jgi:hypothetical protein
MLHTFKFYKDHDRVENTMWFQVGPSVRTIRNVANPLNLSCGWLELVPKRGTIKNAINVHRFKIAYRDHRADMAGTSVVDPYPESDLDPVGSETFCRIQNKSFRIRIRAALTRNEFETELP